MKKQLLLHIPILFILACTNAPAIVDPIVERTDYKVSGVFEDFQDSSMLYLMGDDGPLDSTFVLNNAFEFTGNIDETEQRVIATKDFSQYKYVWFEPADIVLTGDSNLKSLVSSGSELQDENAALMGSLTDVRNRMTEVNKNFALFRGEPSKIDSLEVVYEALNKEEEALNIQHIKDYPNTLISMYLLKIYKARWPKEKVQEIYTNLSEENKQSENGVLVGRFLELNTNPQIGDQYQDFTQYDMAGHELSVSDIEAEIVMIEFWASWCGPCRRSNPDLVAVYKDFSPKGFEILGVSFDDSEESWSNAIEEDSLFWHQVSDLQGFDNEAGMIYSVKAIPDNVLIDSDGIIIARNLEPAELRLKLSELLEV